MEICIQSKNYYRKTPVGGAVGEIQSRNFKGVGPGHLQVSARLWLSENGMQRRWGCEDILGGSRSTHLAFYIEGGHAIKIIRWKDKNEASHSRSSPRASTKIQTWASQAPAGHQIWVPGNVIVLLLSDFT